MKKRSGLRKKKKEKKKRSRKRGGIEKTKSIFLPLPKRNPPSSLTSFELMQRPVSQGRAELHACWSGEAREAREGMRKREDLLFCR